ncbi:MAG: hypothetical protein AAF478_03555 [Pseudomonadota bacterium]
MARRKRNNTQTKTAAPAQEKADETKTTAENGSQASPSSAPTNDPPSNPVEPQSPEPKEDGNQASVAEPTGAADPQQQAGANLDGAKEPADTPVSETEPAGIVEEPASLLAEISLGDLASPEQRRINSAFYAATSAAHAMAPDLDSSEISAWPILGAAETCSTPIVIEYGEYVRKFDDQVTAETLYIEGALKGFHTGSGNRFYEQPSWIRAAYEVFVHVLKLLDRLAADEERKAEEQAQQEAEMENVHRGESSLTKDD